MKNLITFIICVFAFLPINANSSIVKIGNAQQIKCENIYKRDSGPITYDYCQSLKHSGLSIINHYYDKTITDQINPLPIYDLLPVRFYTEDGLLFNAGFVGWYFKRNKVDFVKGDFIIKFDVEPHIPTIPVNNPDEDNNEDNYVSVPEPSTVYIFMIALVILVSISYNRYK